MLVSKKWLNEYLDVNKYSDDELYDIFTAHVCEIETMEKMIDANNLAVGHVLECVAHPDSDHLHVCQVEIAPGVVSQIVCGAPNVTAGVWVIVALPGAVLPGNFKIKPSKIRGVESNGMLCSLQELGIEEKYVPEAYKNGIYLFTCDVTPGDDPLKVLGADTTIYDLAVTSNRSDLLSIEGVAYDLAAAINEKMNPIIPEIKESAEKNPLNVTVTTDKCYKYNARYIKGVKIAESPMWLKAKLIASGIRPISNVVDVTNLVLMEMGQPLHSFDADKLGNTILVRNANEGEKLKTLDDIERTLTANDIVITNGNEAVCVAGVMGGLTTEVDDTTTNIALEAAYFDALSIRRTSSRLNLKSESSTRFERKIDYDRVERALDYAAKLIVELAGGEILSGVARDVKVTPPTKTVTITLDKINNVLGTSLDEAYVTDLFNRLAYSYTLNNGEYVITIPSRRMDLEESVQDIIEDVARMYGYDNIPTTIAATRDKGYLTYKQKRTRLVRQILAFSGLTECVSYSMIAEKNLGLYVENVMAPIKVMMPMTEDRAVMRQSLLNGVIDAVAYNKARKLDNLAFFEIGNVYAENYEDAHLAIAINGLYTSHLWNGEKQAASFYLLKGIADALFSRLNFNVSYEPYTEIKSFHPGRCAKIMHGDKQIGVIGELHPKFAKNMGVSGTYALEITLADITTEENTLKYHSINKYPTIARDLAIVVKKDVPAVEIEKVIKKAGRKTLTDVKLFDLYTGENVGADEKSLAFSLTFEDYTKTLETAEVDEIVKNILAKLEKECGAKLR